MKCKACNQEITKLKSELKGRQKMKKEVETMLDDIVKYNQLRDELKEKLKEL